MILLKITGFGDKLGFFFWPTVTYYNIFPGFKHNSGIWTNVYTKVHLLVTWGAHLYMQRMIRNCALQVHTTAQRLLTLVQTLLYDCTIFTLIIQGPVVQNIFSLISSLMTN